MVRNSLFATVFLSVTMAAIAQDKGVLGNWRTPGGAIIHIAPCGPDVCATLVQSEPNAQADVDGENPDPAKRTRKICGLQIGYGFHLTDPTHADDGHLYDPKSGKTYKGALASTGDQLDLRGYIGIKAFGRSETWTRTSATPSCPA